MSALIVAFVCALLLSEVRSINYYVSTSTGTSGGNALTTATASNSFSGVITLARGGDTIYLCNGDLFVGRFIITFSNIAVSTYDCNAPGLGPPILTSALLVQQSQQLSDVTLSNGLTAWVFDVSSQITSVSPDPVAMTGLWINDHRYIKARYPNVVDMSNLAGQSISEFLVTRSKDTALTSAKVFPTFTVGGGVANVGGLPGSSWVGAKLRIRETNWNFLDGTVTAWNETARTFTSSVAFTLQFAKMGFILEDLYQALDARGEYFFDASTKLLYVVPLTGETLAPTNSGTSTRVGMWGLFGKESTDILNVKNYGTITGLSFEKGSTAIRTEATCARYSITNVAITQVTRNGIYVAGKFVTITSITVSQADLNGVNSYGDSTKVLTSTFTDIAMLHGYGNQPSAIGCATNCTVTGNTVDRSGYSAVKFGGYSVITDNTFTHCQLTLSDGGPIYSWGSMVANVVIRNNHVTYTVPNFVGSPSSSFYPGGAIYCDECTNGWTMQNNVLDYELSALDAATANASSWLPVGMYIHDSPSMNILDNKFKGTAIRIAQHNTGTGCLPRNITMTGNVFTPSANPYDNRQFFRLTTDGPTLKAKQFTQFTGNTMCGTVDTYGTYFAGIKSSGLMIARNDVMLPPYDVSNVITSDDYATCAALYP